MAGPKEEAFVSSPPGAAGSWENGSPRGVGRGAKTKKGAFSEQAELISLCGDLSARKESERS